MYGDSPLLSTVVGRWLERLFSHQLVKWVLLFMIFLCRELASLIVALGRYCTGEQKEEDLQ